MRRTVILACAAIVAAAAPVAGAPVGKVAGRVATVGGEVLPGAAVSIGGVRLGAVTDSDGRYFILCVPPGSYSITAYVAGRRPIRMSDVRVDAARTTRLDFSLPLAGIEIEAQTIAVPPPLVTPEAADTRISVNRDDLADQPAERYIDVLDARAGLSVASERVLVIRGPREQATNFRVDDQRLWNPLDERSYTAVNEGLVEQIQVLTGAFEASYQGSGGTIGAVTRDPARMSALGGNIRYTPPRRQHFGPNAYGNDQYDRLLYANDGMSTNGRLFNAMEGTPGRWTDRVNSNLPVYAVQLGAHAPDGEPVFVGWDSVTTLVNDGAWALGDSLIDKHRGNWTSDALQRVWEHRHREWDYEDAGDLEFDITVSAPVYIVPETRFALAYHQERSALPVPTVEQLFTDRLAEARIHSTVVPRVAIDAYGRFEYIVTTANGVSGRAGPGEVPNGVEWYAGGPVALGGMGGIVSSLNKYNLWSNERYVEQVWGGGARVLHAVGDAVYYQLAGEFLRGETEARPGAKRGTNNNAHHTDANFDLLQLPNGDTVFLDESPWGFDPGSYAGLDVAGAYYLSGGGLVSDFSDWQTTGLHAEVYAQLAPSHGVALGASYEFGRLHRDSRSADRATGANARYTEYEAEPRELALYAQDRVELDDLVANVGVRVESFDPGSQRYFPGQAFPDAYAPGGLAGFGEDAGVTHVDPAPGDGRDALAYINGPLDDDPAWQYAQALLGELPQTEAPNAWRISPRIAVSHALGVRGRVYIGAGKYRRAASTGARYGFVEADGRLGSEHGWIASAGNPELPPSTTTIYEAGAERSLTNRSAIRVRAYSAWESGLPSRVDRVSQAPSPASGGPGYADVGFSTSEPIGYREHRGVETEFEHLGANWLRGFATLDIRDERVGRTDGLVSYGGFDSEPAAGGIAYEESDVSVDAAVNLILATPRAWGPVIGGWELAVQQWYERGREVAYRFDDGLSDPVRLRWADYWRTDARASKTFALEDITITVYADVWNVLDRKTFNIGAVDADEYVRTIVMEGGDSPRHRIGDLDFNVEGVGARTIVDRRLVRENDWLLYLYPREFRFGVRLNL